MEVIVPDRQLVLAQVNAELARYGLKPMSVRDLGMYGNEEFQIVGVNTPWKHPHGTTIDFTFDVIKPRSMHIPGQSPHTTYTLRYTVPVGLVVLVIDGRVLLIKQHRPAASGWTVEFPRSWVEPTVTDDPEDVMRAVLRKEIGPDAVSRLAFTNIVEVAAPHEDSGSKKARLPICYAEATLQGDLARIYNAQKPMLVSWERLYDMVDHGDIDDLFSLGALLKVERMLRRRSDGVRR